MQTLMFDESVQSANSFGQVKGNEQTLRYCVRHVTWLIRFDLNDKESLHLEGKVTKDLNNSYWMEHREKT